MSSPLAKDLQKLKSLAFHRSDWCVEVIREWHRMEKKIRLHPDGRLLGKLHEWLLAPLTFWPENLDALGHQALRFVRSGRRLDASTRLLLHLLPEPPPESAQSVVIQHEHDVQKGSYEGLIHAAHKFNYKEVELEQSEEFSRDWKSLKSLFAVRSYQDHKGIIRREFVLERNVKADFNLHWDRKEGRFYAVFNTFCLKWNLYGMMRDRPLLLKTTVNLTPYGTLIFIPAYWNFDPKRDLKWRSITALHRARGAQKQGAKLSRNQMERREEARAADRFNAEARNLGLKGSEREYWVMGQLGWVAATDPSRLRRLLKSVK